MSASTSSSLLLRTRVLAASAVLSFGAAGCGTIHGRPGPGPEVIRPQDELHFETLYNDNCAACHGANGRDGAQISLANPAYVAVAKDHLHDIIANGVANHLMPAFAQSAGGMLTGPQVTVLAEGIVKQWGNPGAFTGLSLPPYVATLKGDAQRGQQAYAIFCARCHGANGEGGPFDSGAGATPSGSGKAGPIVDPSYLSLVSDQNLRSITIGGRPDQGMPDWRTDAAQPMTDQQITDVVAWMAAKRVADPGQPYPSNPQPSGAAGK